MTFHLCIEGGEGTYKTTTCEVLSWFYRNNSGFEVLETKEPGVSFLPSTMKLRELALSNEYDKEMTPISRELVLQAIRSNHINYLEKNKDKFDMIIQDRGILSSRYYAEACGHSHHNVKMLEELIGVPQFQYDMIIIFHNANGLDIATNAKNEFGCGDAMESRGREFHDKIENLFLSTPETIDIAKTVRHVNVAGRRTDSIVKECVDLIYI